MGTMMIFIIEQSPSKYDHCVARPRPVLLHASSLITMFRVSVLDVYDQNRDVPGGFTLKGGITICQ